MIIFDYKIKPTKPKIPFTLAVNQQILLMPFGDLHFGIKAFPLESFRETIQWGLDRGAYFLGMGDYFDFTSFSQRKIIATSRDEVKTYLSERVEEMILQLLVLLRSTKDRWLGMIEGNHYWEFDDGTTSDQKLCEAMSCHFLGTDAKITLKFDKAPAGHPEIFASIFCVHGANAPEYVGTNLNKIERLLEWLDADIFLMGHSHRKVGAPIDRVQFTPEGIEYHRTKVIARTGGWYTPYHAHPPLSLKKPAIQSRGTYIEKKAGSPSALGTLVIGIGYEKIMGSKYYRPTIHYSM